MFIEGVLGVAIVLVLLTIIVSCFAIVKAYQLRKRIDEIEER